MASQPIGQEWDDRTYRGVGPHPADPRAAEIAAQVAALIAEVMPGTVVDHVGSTAVPGMVGKNIMDLQITADPADVPTNDPDVTQMIEFRDLLRRDPAARQAYTDDKHQISAGTSDVMEYTHAKTQLIRQLLGG